MTPDQEQHVLAFMDAMAEALGGPSPRLAVDYKRLVAEFDEARKKLARRLGKSFDMSMADLIEMVDARITNQSRAIEEARRAEVRLDAHREELARTLGAGGRSSLSFLIDLVRNFRAAHRELTEATEGERRRLAQVLERDEGTSLHELVTDVGQRRSAWRQRITAGNPHDRSLLDAFNALADANAGCDLDEVKKAEVKLARVKHDHRKWYVENRPVA